MNNHCYLQGAWMCVYNSFFEVARKILDFLHNGITIQWYTMAKTKLNQHEYISELNTFIIHF